MGYERKIPSTPSKKDIAQEKFTTLDSSPTLLPVCGNDGASSNTRPLITHHFKLITNSLIRVVM
jgi:hypothetical protein